MAHKQTPLYGQIIEYLKREIEDGKFQPGDKLPTEQELAAMFGVSRITSNRALVELEREGIISRVRGSGSYLSSKTQRKAAQSNEVIALVLPFDSWLGGMVDAIRAASESLGDDGYYLSIHNTNRSAQKEREVLLSLLHDGVSGIIFYPTADRANLDLIYHLYVQNFPIVAIDKAFEGISISSVVSDNLSGGYAAARHLLEMGHRNIAFFSARPIEDVITVRHRFFGYCNALKDHGIPVDLDMVKLGIDLGLGNTHRVGEEAKEIVGRVVRELLDLGVTAFQAENDYVALNLLQVLSDLGVKVPDEVSLVGFDNIDQSDAFGLSLTTIEQDFDELGRSAAQIVLEHLRTPGFQPVQKVIPVSLVERKSTSVVKGAAITGR